MVRAQRGDCLLRSPGARDGRAHAQHRLPQPRPRAVRAGGRGTDRRVGARAGQGNRGRPRRRAGRAGGLTAVVLTTVLGGNGEECRPRYSGGARLSDWQCRWRVSRSMGKAAGRAEDVVKFRVERDVLGEAVSWVARALPTRPVVPVLSGMVVRADAAGLTLSCFDYEVSARVVVPADVGEPGEALVPGRLLAEITRSLPAAAAEVTSAGDMLMLTCGSAEFSLVALALAEYPSLPELPSVIGIVDGGALSTAAAQVVPSSSRDDTLPMLTGVCMDISGDRVTFAATDRYRLAVRTIGWEPADPDIAARALVPARTLADIAKTMSSGVPVTVAFGSPGGEPGRGADGLISFEGGGRRLTARLIGGEFIRYESRFPADFGSTADLPAVQFADAVRRVSLVAH